MVLAGLILPFTGAHASDAPEIIVTASRSGEPIALEHVLSTVTLLDEDALEDRQTRIVSDILRDVPGVAVSRAGSAGGLTQVRIRGTESNHVLVLIDGIEVSDPFAGEFDFGSLLADPAARIEVLRGQQSSLYGSDAIGGVIHYMTLTGAEAPGLNIRAEAGSFETLNASGRAAGVSGDFDYAVSASYYHSGGYPTARSGSRDVGSDTLGATAKLTWAPADALKISGVLRYSNSRADQNEPDENPFSPLFGQIVDSPGVHFESEAVYGLLSATLLSLDDRWTNSLSAQFADIARESYVADSLDFGSEGTRLKASYVSSLDLEQGDLRHQFTAAIDAERETYRNTTPATGSPFDPFTGKRHNDTLGLVGEYGFGWKDTLLLGASIRHDDNSRFDGATTYRLQGQLAFVGSSRLRASWGSGIKNPGFYELFGFIDGTYIGNPDLRPEKSVGWEVGLEHSFADGATLIGAAYFDSTLNDEIFTDFPPPDFVSTPANRLTRSRQRGVEIYATSRPTSNFRFDFAYAYLDAIENEEAEVRRPRHSGSINGTYQTDDGVFSGTLTVRYNGSMTDLAYTDPSYIPVRERLDDYVLVNLGAEYRLSESVTVNGRVENLLDDNYEEIFSYRAAGRSAYAGVRAHF